MKEISDILIEAKNEIENFRKNNPNGVVVIWGATATGKSKLSLLLSEFFDVEIISADSRQIFKYMDIGTDKVSQEMRQKIVHHQIDIIDPKETYTSGQWQHDVNEIVEQILKKGALPIIVGGTGLYIDMIYKNFSMPEASPDYEYRDMLYKEEENNPGSLRAKLQKIDPEEAVKLHPNSIRYIVRALEIHHVTGETKTKGFVQTPVRRPLLMLGLRRDKEDSNKRINSRIKEMLQMGLIDEVKGLINMGYNKTLQSMKGIGYKETVEFLEGKHDIEELEERMKKATHHLAKKQRTWFKRYIAEGKATPKENVTYKVWEL